MHDKNLRRTTNIKEVFPDRSSDDPSLFTINEIKQLDAGYWFSHHFKGTKIPTFHEVVELAVIFNVWIIFDIYVPSDGHPFSLTYRENLYNWYLNSSMPEDKVIAFNSHFFFLFGIFLRKFYLQ